MNYETLKKLLTVSNPRCWVNGKKVAMDNGVAVWEYDFGGIGSPHVVVRGVDSNNPKLQFSSSAYGVFVDGKKVGNGKIAVSGIVWSGGIFVFCCPANKIKTANTKSLKKSPFGDFFCG